MRIGIFGGSFNPPHQMHLEIGKQMISYGYVDYVIYVPTGKKYPKSDLLDDELRYEMTCLMAEGDERLDVSDYELKNHLVYTYQTLEYFKEKYPKDEIFLILGSDLYRTFSSWKKYQSILKDYPILVVLRNGDSLEELAFFYRDIKKQVIFTDVSPVQLSSTEIRRAIRNEKFSFVREHLSSRVFNYVIERKLYQ